MPEIVAPVPAAPQLYAARQVRYIDPAQNGVIHFVDGSTRTFNITTGTPAITYVPTTNAGNVVPNAGDWILDARLPWGAAAGGPGTQTLVEQLQTPNAPVVINPGPYLYFTNAQFNSGYNSNYAAATPNQGIVAK